MDLVRSATVLTGFHTQHSSGCDSGLPQVIDVDSESQGSQEDESFTHYDGDIYIESLPGPPEDMGLCLLPSTSSANFVSAQAISTSSTVDAAQRESKTAPVPDVSDSLPSTSHSVAQSIPKRPFLQYFGLLPKSVSSAANKNDDDDVVVVNDETPKSSTEIPELMRLLTTDFGKPVLRERGDPASDSLQLFGRLRSVLCIDISSPLGHRLSRSIRSFLMRSGSATLSPCTVTHSLVGSSSTLSYEEFCRTPAKTLPSRLRGREFVVRYKPHVGYCHEICFSRAERRRFCQRFDAGLSASSWRRMQHMPRCSISLDGLTDDEIADWQSSERLRAAVERSKQREAAALAAAAKRAEEALADSTSACQSFIVVNGKLFKVQQKSQIAPGPSNCVTIHRRVPTRPELQRRQVQPSVVHRPERPQVNTGDNVIDISSDSSDDETSTAANLNPPTAMNLVFKCHLCSTEISCGASTFRDVFQSHYRNVHHVYNIDAVRERNEHGQWMLSIVQRDVQPTPVNGVSANSMPTVRPASLNNTHSPIRPSSLEPRRPWRPAILRPGSLARTMAPNGNIMQQAQTASRCLFMRPPTLPPPPLPAGNQSDTDSDIICLD